MKCVPPDSFFGSFFGIPDFTKFNPDPAMGAYDAPPDSLVGSRGYPSPYAFSVSLYTPLASRLVRGYSLV